jgi:hypothetical protein
MENLASPSSNRRPVRLIKHRFIILLLILTVTALSYFNVIDGEFQFDDYRVLMTDPLLKEPSKLSTMAISEILFSGKRPFTTLSFSVNYAIGGLDVKGYHILNILLHLCMVSLVYFFVKKLLCFRVPDGAFRHNTELISLSITALYALHPLGTSTVSYISQRGELLASIFYLLSLMCLIRFSEKHSRKSPGFMILAITFFLLGWISKEIVLTVPLMFLIYIVFFSETKQYKRILIGMLPFLGIGLFLGISFLHTAHNSGHIGFNIKELGQPEYFYTQLRVLLTYLRLIFIPASQNFDYDYPVYTDFWDLNVFAALLFWIIVIISSLSTLRVQGRWKWHFRSIGFGVLWFLILLLPTSSLVPVKDVIFEHRVYLALMGIVFASVICADMCLKKLDLNIEGKTLNAFVVLTVSSLILILIAATYSRNHVWQSKFSLWLDVVKKSPQKARPANNLGNCYFLAGDYLTAREFYRGALLLDPGYMIAYSNLFLTEQTLSTRYGSDILSKE